MTKKWLSQTPNPPRIPEFYTLTKIHKPTITGRPIISGCDGPTERISSFVDTLLQPILKSQESYLKDTTDFINFIERTSVNKQTFLAKHTTSFTIIALQYPHTTSEKCLVTQYEPAVPNIKQILMKTWHDSKKSSKIHPSYLLRKENL